MTQINVATHALQHKGMPFDYRLRLVKGGVDA